MKHVIIIIFDAVKYNQILIEVPVEDKFKKIQFNSDFTIFYLKLQTPFGQSPKDLLAIIRDMGDGTYISTISENNDFTKKSELANAASFIKTQVDPQAKFYLISLGHGSGFGFFVRTFSSIGIEENTPEKNCSIAFRRNVEYSTLWNIEFSEAFQDYSFELAMFNNCNVLTFEACAIFSRFIKKIIATENYLSLPMFELENVINDISKRVETDPELYIDAAFESYLIGCLNTLLVSRRNLPQPSLYLLDLIDFEKLIAEYENIGAGILSIDQKNPGWIEIIRNQQGVPSIPLLFIDLIEFLETVRNSDMIDIAFRNQIDNFITELKNKILKEWVSITQPEMNGISIFFPPVNRRFGLGKYYPISRMIMCQKEELKPSNWDFILDVVNSRN